MTNLKRIEEVATSLNNDLVKVSMELKRIQSIKCRLKKQSGKSTYESEMRKVLEEEEVLKQVRQLLSPKDKSVTQYEQEDVDRLDYDETIKAIKSIQSKKTLTKWLTTIEGDNDEYREACRIEKMLLDHKENVRPIDETTIRKTSLVTIIETIESTQDISRERVIELLKGLL